MTNPDGDSTTTTSRSAASAGDLLTPVSVGRMSEVIVDQLRLLIRSGKVVAGDRLPSERELCQRFGVSRVTVREALRVLEANGLVEIRVGARGGAFVTAPSSKLVGEGIADLISLSTVTAVEVTETRMVLELGIVAMVCERATAEDIAELYRICDVSDQAVSAGTYPLSLSADWHIAFARATHNRSIAMLAESLHDPLVSSLEHAREAAPAHGSKGVEEHRALVDAVSQGDVVTATAIMTSHLTRTAERVGAAEGADSPA